MENERPRLDPIFLGFDLGEVEGDLGELEAIEPIRNLKFGHLPLQEAVDKAIQKIHKRFFTRECPFCAEIIKKRAKICKHCQKEVAGV